MSNAIKVGIIICDWYRTYAGGKCLRAMRNREGAFAQYTDTFKGFIEKRYGVKVVVGTHPIPKKYLDLHTSLGTWKAAEWQPLLVATMTDEATRLAYD